jgi:hypothetical protein
MHGSYRIVGTVAEWESWLGMAFPESGDYVFPGGLSPLAVDREADTGKRRGRCSICALAQQSPCPPMIFVNNAPEKLILRRVAVSRGDRRPGAEGSVRR